jgi:hypothetical protein
LSTSRHSSFIALHIHTFPPFTPPKFAPKRGASRSSSEGSGAKYFRRCGRKKAQKGAKYLRRFSVGGGRKRRKISSPYHNKEKVISIQKYK